MGSGRLFLFVGSSGVGKTTATKYLLSKMPKSKFVKLYVTRSPRSLYERFFSFEYNFVTKERYKIIKSQSGNWDENITQDNFYGTDVDWVINQVQNGFILFTNVLPKKKELSLKLELFQCEKTVIYIEHNRDLSQFISKDRLKRQENSYQEISDLIDFKFNQTGNKKEDLVNLYKLVKSIV